MDKKTYRVLGVYDTETTNIELEPGEWRAFPVAFIVNDLRDVNLRTYAPDESREHIRIYRHASDFHAWIDDLVAYGKRRDLVPVVCAYNLSFDLQPVLYELCKRYEVTALARSSTHIYTLDLVQEGEPVLRFWDTFHMETGGLGQMGRICDFKKASGDWDYSLIRTPETPLTELEEYYATRDVQVIPAYLNYLYKTQPVEDPDSFGIRVLTKTSLVRQMARNEIGKYQVKTMRGKTNLLWLYGNRCKDELPYSYECYALRKASFRGGLTFTAAATASTIQKNVSGFDVVSMHHLYLNARRVPVELRPKSREVLRFACDYVIERTLEDVLRRYDYPFAHCFHALLEFRNLRPRKGSPFERQGIALLASSKFESREIDSLDFTPDLRNTEAENAIRDAGFYDRAIGGVFAFGKLVSAKLARVHVSEVELWNMAQVYEWDSYEVITGEHTIKTVIPPDYVSMQSNILYTRKNDAKYLDADYTGDPFKGEIPDSIPEGIAEQLRSGTIDPNVFHSWYQVSVKGSFNGIYGTQAQDQLRPDFIVEEGEFSIDPETKTTPENFFEKLPDKTTVWYNYGMRIVAGSRMHLIIGILLLDKVFGDKVKVLGGDTDSLKVQHSPDIKPSEILEAFKPLHDAADKAIKICQQRNRRLYEKAATFESLGHFEYEGTSEIHFEAWNKARVGISEGAPHITCAGLMRPPGLYHIENWIAERIEGGDAPEAVLEAALGYNGTVLHDVCHAREHYRPEARDKLDIEVTDYLGNKSRVNTYESIAIYPSSREVGGLDKVTNLQNVRYLERTYGRRAPKREHLITLKDGKAALYVANDYGELELCTAITTGTLL